MNRKRTTILSVIMILVMMGMMLLPTAMGNPVSVDAFTITINSGQSTSITATTDTTFEAALAGSTNELADSFDLTNVGNAAATVDAKFTTLRDATYGLNGSTYVIPGTAFAMTGVIANSYVALVATDTDTEITGSDVAADDVADVWKVRLIVPAGQEADSYSGTVQLTFS